MRQGQQNRRGRNRGGRKPQNSMTRNFESSGPDVKIRGTAMHIAEKYTSLARDAMASGDIIGAENYLQHAEHYNRIIMAAQAQNAGAPGMDGVNGANGGRFGYGESYSRDFDGGFPDDGEEGDFIPSRPQFHERPPMQERAPNYNQHQQPQPYIPPQAFPQAQPQPVIAGGNGTPVQPGEAQAAPQDGDRAPRRRRRRPMGDAPRGYNGRNGGAHAPASDVNGVAPGGDAAPEDAA